MRETACMCDLAEENRAFVVHSLHNGLPRFHLLLRPNAGGIRKAVAVLRDPSAFRDEKPTRRGTLRVVDSDVRLRHAVGRAGSRQRSHHYPATREPTRYIVKLESSPKHQLYQQCAALEDESDELQPITNSN